MINQISYFIQRKIIPGFKINKNALVVDLGSGDKPFWRADVFFDKTGLENNQRNTQTETITNLGLFVDGDVSKTPFKDKSFDFSFCAHLLEHVEDPEKVIKEIMRISRAGYIEVPNGFFDSIDPFPTHLWLIYLDKNKLIFVRKDKRLTEIMKKNGERYKSIKKKIKDPFIRIYWKDKINYEIINDLNEKEIYVPFDKINKQESSNSTTLAYKTIIQFIRFLFYKKKNINLKDIIK